MATDTTTQQIVDVVTPAAGESVSEGTILEWHVEVGEAIKADDTIVEISTDKVDVELPSPATGTVSEILVAEGDTVTVGQVIARIAVGASSAPAAAGAGDDGEESGEPRAQEPAAPAAGEGNGSGGSPPAVPAPPAEPPGAAPGIVDVVTPAAGESVSEGTILEWHVGVGEPIRASDTIVEISTDKVDVELPAPATGTVTEILAQEGETVTVGQVIARIAVGASEPAPAAGASTPQGGDGAPGAGTASAAAGTRVSPVAARAAAAEGVDLAGVSGSGREGRITKSDVLSAAGNGAPAAAPQKAETQLMKGGAAALARYMEESRSIPTATSFRTLTVSVLDARRRELKAAARKVSFTHLIAYAIARRGRADARDGQPLRSPRRAPPPRPRRPGQPRAGGRRREEGRHADADGARDPDAGGLGFEAFLAAYDALVEKARTNSLTADDLVGANITLTNPGGIGTIASVPRLMSGQGTILATGSIAYPVGLAAIGAAVGAEKVMTMTSTYDHRIIQGAESGRFLALIEEHLQGEHGFYEDVFGALGVELGPPPPPPAPAAVATLEAAPSPAAASEEMLQAVQAATTLVHWLRTHGHLAARLDPLGSEPEGDPALDPEALGLTLGAAGADPGEAAADLRPGRDARRRPPAPARGLLRHDRLRDRAHRLAPAARLAAREDRVRRLPPRAHQRRTSRRSLKRLIEVDALERFMHKAYLGQHQFSIEGLDMTVPMLDELIQLSAAHGGQRGRGRDGPPRAAERARTQPRPPLRDDLRRVRGRLDARGRDDDPAGRHRRRQVPPRHPGHLHAARRRHDPRQPRVQPEPPRVRLGRRRGRDARRPDLAHAARTPTRTRTRRCRS